MGMEEWGIENGGHRKDLIAKVPGTHGSMFVHPRVLVLLQLLY